MKPEKGTIITAQTVVLAGEALLRRSGIAGRKKTKQDYLPQNLVDLEDVASQLRKVVCRGHSDASDGVGELLVSLASGFHTGDGGGLCLQKTRLPISPNFTIPVRSPPITCGHRRGRRVLIKDSE